MAKVIDITSRVRHQNHSGSLKGKVASIVDMTSAREEMLTKDRRDVKRTILTEFVGAYVILPERGLMKVALYDISDSGVAFDLSPTEGQFKDGEEVAMRVYLNHTTYFPFTVKVSNSRMMADEGVVRHGAQLLKESTNDVALHHFVKFIENVSACLRKDDGDIVVSNIS